MERPPATAARGIPSPLGLQSGNYRPDFPPSSVAGSFKLDEGYSDETRSQAENEVAQMPDDALKLPGWILAHEESERAGAFNLPKYLCLLKLMTRCRTSI